MKICLDTRLPPSFDNASVEDLQRSVQLLLEDLISVLYNRGVISDSELSELMKVK